ncbi:MAG: hypothetical protein OXD31_14235 [Chloroflexi bacterium]|nr:hypothetical protein [Chloroflexota bacterium]
MSFYVPDSWVWVMPFFIGLLFAFFILPIAVLATLGMWFQRKSGREILRVLTMILGGFAALLLVGIGIGYLLTMFNLPSWLSGGILFGIVAWIALMRKKVVERLDLLGKAMRQFGAGQSEEQA